MLHSISMTWFQTSHYCHAKVEFNSINNIEFGTAVANLVVVNLFFSACYLDEYIYVRLQW